MSQNVYQFIDLQRVDPPKKPLKIRKIEFVKSTSRFQARPKAQADRCLSCGNPYCEWKCPVHNYIPNWLKLANEGRIFEAASCLTRPTPAGSLRARLPAGPSV
jgi:glutamate synthase (NADPH/NADH) small chain